MSYHHRYKLRDYVFAQRLLSLRKRTALTQEAVALHVGVTEKAIRNWEGGSNYPSEANLRKLLELYLDQDAFAPSQELDEARTLWDQLRASTHRISSFDELWFATLLKQWRARRISLAPQHEAFRPAAAPAVAASRLPQADWGAALDVSSVYGRSQELAELEGWVLSERRRLVAVLGTGGIGKTTLAVKLMQQVAAHFDGVPWRSLYK